MSPRGPKRSSDPGLGDWLGYRPSTATTRKRLHRGLRAVDGRMVGVGHQRAPHAACPIRLCPAVRDAVGSIVPSGGPRDCLRDRLPRLATRRLGSPTSRVRFHRVAIDLDDVDGSLTVRSKDPSVGVTVETDMLDPESNVDDEWMEDFRQARGNRPTRSSIRLVAPNLGSGSLVIWTPGAVTWTTRSHRRPVHTRSSRSRRR